jgi:two-component system chemotaxis sensor kinase CheA
MRTLLGQRGSNLLELDGGELDGLCKELEAGASGQVALERLRFLRLEPAERPFWRLAKHAVELGKRLGKGDVAVRVDTRGIRTDPRRWTPLWSDLVHLVRNAVDHGLETPDERRRAGKPPRPHVWLEASVSAGKFVVTLGDDGRGIDWTEVRRLARLRGLPAVSEHDLTCALFSPGLTTRREVTAISGRGIGLTAVLERVEQLGGTIVVESHVERGSSWSLSFPLPPGGAETVMAPARRARTTGAAASVLPG